MQARRAFTLIEILISVAILALVVLLLNVLVKHATALTTLTNKRMTTDAQARLVFDRMAADFAQMIKRPDVDYYLKPTGYAGPSAGANDQIAFFSQVAGYYPTPSYQSPTSVVAYRINNIAGSSSYRGLERLGKGLVWSGVSPAPTVSPSPSQPWMIFGLGKFSPSASPSPTATPAWPSAVSDTVADSDYEPVGAQIFRFEYFFLLTDGTITDGVPPNTTVTPGFQNVAAIVVSLAAIDPQSRVLLSDNNIATLIARLQDFNATTVLSDLTSSWQAALDATTDMPRQAINSIRIYQRAFYVR